MSSPARSTRLANNARGFDTVVERTRGGLKMRHATDANRFVYDTQAGGKGWHFGSGPYTEANEVDTTWQVGDNAPYRRKMVLADYNAFAGLDNAINFDAGQIVKYQHTSGANITFQPQQLQFTNDLGQIQSAGDVATVGATVNDDILRWNNAFGAGRHFEWQTQTTRLSKRLIIDTLASLPTPNATILSGANPVLRLQFIFQKSAGVDIYVDGVLWNEAANNPKSTTGAVEFKSGANLLWAFMPAFAWDSGAGARPTVVQRVRKTGPNLFVEVRVPWSWIQSAVFPIFVDPTIDDQVDTSTGDGSWRESGTSFSATYAELAVGHDTESGNVYDNTYCRFVVTIPSSSTIDVMYMTLTDRWSGSAASTEVLYSAVDASNPSAPTTYSGAEDATRTTATATETFTYSPVENAERNTTSLVGIGQELVDSYDFSSGAAMLLYMQANGLNSTWDRYKYFAYDDTTTKAPKLHIEYTTGGTVVKDIIGSGIIPFAR